MTATQKLYLKALALPTEARAELTDRLISSLGQGVAPDVERAQVTEVRRRIAQVESGTAKLMPGRRGVAQVRAAIRKRAGRNAS